MGRSEAGVRHGDPAVSDQASASPQAATAHASHEPDASVTESEAPTTAEPQAKARVDSPAEVPDHWVAIKAPMVGTFYRSPKPGDPAFVDAGDVVALGDTVGLVEVMKLFTELKTEVAGKVARIDVDDTALVEFGQPLIWIEPA